MGRKTLAAAGIVVVVGICQMVANHYLSLGRSALHSVLYMGWAIDVGVIIWFFISKKAAELKP